ncbi:MAG: hypothetical protein ACYSWU_25435 [Planctomycetota bacterium]|jgi:hypothetical protein
MSHEELRRGLDELRRVLNAIDPAVTLEDAPAEAVRALGQAVDGVRSNVWTLLTAQHADEYQDYVGKIRVCRATETCEDVLAELYADTLSPNIAGLDVFHATLRELARMCRAPTP